MGGTALSVKIWEDGGEVFCSHDISANQWMLEDKKK